MKQVTNLKNVETDLLLPGIVRSTSPTDYRPIKQLQSPDRKIIMFRLTSRLRAALFSAVVPWAVSVVGHSADIAATSFGSKADITVP